ncbi:unnamed protein product [Blepharisma stoltei]|uniref:MIR domain-containing protein n=1 Tax=Blepharisma stoltei TaxID=1481888 RepID=A0AAU9K1P7_9CILI|nr:unnamed protein product [Blepharisma stoltei]
MAEVPIRYGVPIKLVHHATHHSLHSHPHALGSGTHQQEVTGFGSRDDNDWWIVKGPDGNGPWNCPIGTPVLNHQIIRLEHLATGKNLHSSPGVHSPSSHQQEICAFGEHGVGDVNDNWRLEVEGQPPNTPWFGNHHIRLIHVQSNHSLHSHHGHKIRDQQEITGYDRRDENDFWTVERIA